MRSGATASLSLRKRSSDLKALMRMSEALRPKPEVVPTQFNASSPEAAPSSGCAPRIERVGSDSRPRGCEKCGCTVAPCRDLGCQSGRGSSREARERAPNESICRWSPAIACSSCSRRVVDVGRARSSACASRAPPLPPMREIGFPPLAKIRAARGVGEPASQPDVLPRPALASTRHFVGSQRVEIDRSDTAAQGFRNAAHERWLGRTEENETTWSSPARVNDTPQSENSSGTCCASSRIKDGCARLSI
jgi:hypothetical protein